MGQASDSAQVTILMGLGNRLGFGADGQERILEDDFSAKRGIFIKARGQDLWAGRAALGLCRVTAYILCSWGRLKRIYRLLEA